MTTARRQVSEKKLKKHGGADLSLQLSENPDILASLSAQTAHPFLVGFAAETHDVASYAQGKLRHKGLDMIAANQVGGGLGFEAADNALTLVLGRWLGASCSVPASASWPDS